MSKSPLVIEPLNQGLAHLFERVRSGEYAPKQGNDMDFLHVLKNTDQPAVPFRPMLKLNIDTHPQGYQEQA